MSAPLVAERDLDMRPDQVRSGLFVKLYVGSIALAAGLATAFLLGGESRFAGPSFTGPRNLVEWQPYVGAYIVWGVGFLAYAATLIVLLGRPLAVHALRFGIVLYLFLVIGFTGSVVSDPRAAASGIVAYTAFAIAHLILQDHLSSRGWERC